MTNTNREATDEATESTVTARIRVAHDGLPSAYYDDAERHASGAADFAVEIIVAEGGVQVAVILSDVTLYADRINGGVGPCGTPLDVWCSGVLVAWLHNLDDASYRECVRALACPGEDTTIEIALR